MVRRRQAGQLHGTITHDVAVEAFGDLGSIKSHKKVQVGLTARGLDFGGANHAVSVRIPDFQP